MCFALLTVDAKILAEVLEFAQGEVRFDPAKDTKSGLLMTFGSNQTMLLQGAVEVVMPKLNPLNRYVQDAAGLARAFRMALPCCAFEDTRPILQTVNITASDGTERVAASDGFRVMFSQLGTFKGAQYGMNISQRLVELFLPVLDDVALTADDANPQATQ